MAVDVAIIGGGPAGSTAGTLLTKYNPRLKVLVLERETFPRDHVGESQLPVVSKVLDEMEVWDKIEAAGFPVKIGATYRWGKTKDLWDFEFLPNGVFHPEARPSKYAGQRLRTAFQADRAVYDEILLDHAKWMGCDVKEETSVRSVKTNGDRVEGLVLDDGTEVQARYYIDASGHSGILRRAMGVEVETPTSLQNIAIYDYWRNADWAVSVGVGGTRVQVLSQAFGWIWFIPLGPDRTSIGLIVPASYYKSTGQKPQDLYDEAVRNDPRVAKLIKNATCEQKLTTTKDWSFLAKRLAGDNWFLAGESAGFADPILAAGMSLAHVGARDVAYTILALDRGEFDAEWLKGRYDSSHRSQIGQHIRFADYWYTHNGVFSDLKDYAKEIAGDAGLAMSADEAWRWFGQGGFIDHNGATGFGGYSLTATKHISATFGGDTPFFDIVGKTHFVLNLEGAEKTWIAEMDKGRITRRRSYTREGKTLSGAYFMGWLVNVLKTEHSYEDLNFESANYMAEHGYTEAQIPKFRNEFFDILEAMVSDGWVVARTEPGARAVPRQEINISPVIHPNTEEAST